MKNRQKNITMPKDAYDALINTLKKNDNDDSIAHRIKRHFERGTIENHSLMKYDRERKILLISKKQLNHLTKLSCSCETRTEYEFELIAEINHDKIFK